MLIQMKVHFITTQLGPRTQERVLVTPTPTPQTNPVFNCRSPTQIELRQFWHKKKKKKLFIVDVTSYPLRLEETLAVIQQREDQFKARGTPHRQDSKRALGTCDSIYCTEWGDTDSCMSENIFKIRLCLFTPSYKSFLPTSVRKQGIL